MTAGNLPPGETSMVLQDDYLQPESVPVTAEEEAYNYILERIRRGEYEPGDRLKAEDIASGLGMSRMPIREALRRLSAEGLLVMRPNRGATVRALTLDDIREIFEMRSVLEGLALRLAVPRVNDRALETLEELLERMERSRHRDDGEWLTHHRRFHETACRLSGRPRLVREVSSLHTAIEPYIRVWFINSDKPIGANAQREHEQILDALRGGDPQKAERVMQHHILTTAPDLARFL